MATLLFRMGLLQQASEWTCAVIFCTCE